MAACGSVPEHWWANRPLSPLNAQIGRSGLCDSQRTTENLMNRMARKRAGHFVLQVALPQGAESQADNLAKTTVEKDLWVQG